MGVLLASSGWRPGIPQCLTAFRMLLTAKNDAAKDGGSADAEEPWSQVI